MLMLFNVGVFMVFMVFYSKMLQHVFSCEFYGSNLKESEDENTVNTNEIHWMHPQSFYLNDCIHNMNDINCDQGVRQLNLIENKYMEFSMMISSKLSPNELIYVRYKGVMDHLYSAVLDNLKQAFFSLKCSRSIDRSYLLSRLIVLEKGSSKVDQYEKETLQQRLGLLEEQTNLANHLFLKNEQALMELDFVMARIAKIDMNKSKARVNLDKVMNDLNCLSKKYDSSIH